MQQPSRSKPQEPVNDAIQSNGIEPKPQECANEEIQQVDAPVHPKVNTAACVGAETSSTVLPLLWRVHLHHAANFQNRLQSNAHKCNSMTAKTGTRTAKNDVHNATFGISKMHPTQLRPQDQAYYWRLPKQIEPQKRPCTHTHTHTDCTKQPTK